MDSKFPLISCVMPTYGRPRYLPEALACFVWQDYPNKELIIVNDCEGQEFFCDLPGVKVVNSRERFKTLGEKRNYCISLAKGSVIAVWDDDDISLPWRLSHTLIAMEQTGSPFYRPSEFLAYWGSDELHDNRSVPGWVSHGPSAFTKELWEQVGGYPAVDLGEDAIFFERIHHFLDAVFLKTPISRSDRSYVLRGVSEYHHMSIGGGRKPLDTHPGVFQLTPAEIADTVLNAAVSRTICDHGIHHPNARTASSLERPLLSICVSVKDRSKLIYEDRILDLFPRCVRSLSDAAHEIGPMELIVSDFSSTDLPLTQWLYGAGSLQIRVLPVEGDFSRGKGVNLAVSAARSDSLFITDADILVDADAIRRGLNDIQAGVIRFPICRNLNEEGKAFAWRDLGRGLVFLSRKQFHTVGMIPEFESWGGEDDIFFGRSKTLYNIVQEHDPGLRHQWHPEWSRHVHYRNASGSDYLNHTGAEMKVNRRGITAAFVGDHQHWELEKCRLELYDDGRMERIHVEGGEYEWFPGERLVLMWDNWPKEVLEWNAEEESYCSQEKMFSLKQVPEKLDSSADCSVPSLEVVADSNEALNTTC